MSDLAAKRYRVALDCRLLNWPGVGRYCRELAASLVKQADDIDFFWLCLPGAGSDLPHAKNAQLVTITANSFSLLEQIQLPFVLSRLGIDLLHAPVAHNVPCFGVKIIVTMHDLILKRFPEFKPNLVVRAYYNLMNSISMHRAQRVICVSEFTRHDVMRDWPHHTKKLVTVLNGVSEQFCPQQEGSHHLNFPDKYLLYVGTLKRHKNLPRLLEAYSQLSTHLREQYPLVLVAQEDERYPEVAEAIYRYQLQANILWRPDIPDADMPVIYASAHSLLLVSLYEGFGLPVAEAMACGTPCVVSDRSAMAEIGGDAVLLCDCKDPASILHALKLLLTNDSLRAELSERALAQSRKFSWHTAAQEIAVLYRECIKTSRAAGRYQNSASAGSQL